MSKFQCGDQIRHRTGTKLYLVLDNPSSGNYSLSGFGDGGETSVLACNVVDANYILYERRIHNEVMTEDPQRVQQWNSDLVVDMETAGRVFFMNLPRGFGKPVMLKQLAKAAKTQRFAEGYGGSIRPFKIDRSLKLPADVAFTLEGIPQGYYLKAFRVAGPADLIIKTNGNICHENWSPVKDQPKSLLRPIIAKIPEAKPDVPGIPAGYELVRVGRVELGEEFVGMTGEAVVATTQVQNKNRAIVRKKVSLQPCNGILPGIPLGFTVVRFGDVSPEEFYFDTAGTLKQGPSKNRLVLKKGEPPVCIPPWMKGPVIKGPVDWGVVDRKVRNDAVDAAAYAFNHLKQCESRVYRAKTETVDVTDADPTVQVEFEYVDVHRSQDSPSVWTSASETVMKGSRFIPTGRSRKVKVL